MSIFRQAVPRRDQLQLHRHPQAVVPRVRRAAADLRPQLHLPRLQLRRGVRRRQPVPDPGVRARPSRRVRRRRRHSPTRGVPSGGAGPGGGLRDTRQIVVKTENVERRPSKLDVVTSVAKDLGIPTDEDQRQDGELGLGPRHHGQGDPGADRLLDRRVDLYLAYASSGGWRSAAFSRCCTTSSSPPGVYSLVGFEVTPSTVVGLLTILGFSLYDTVVVYDKVAENSKDLLAGSRMTFSEAANLAVNQTLMRSINTSLIALLPVAGLAVRRRRHARRRHDQGPRADPVRRPGLRCVLLAVPRDADRRRPHRAAGPRYQALTKRVVAKRSAEQAAPSGPRRGRSWPARRRATAQSAARPQRRGRAPGRNDRPGDGEH